MTWLWILIAALILLFATGGKKQNNTNQKKSTPHWIYHPHVIETDDYECSYCHARIHKEAASTS